MVQKICKKCSSITETDSNRCPHCGASYEKGLGCFAWGLIIIFALWIIGSISDSIKNSNNIEPLKQNNKISQSKPVKKPLKEKIMDMINKELGATVNWDKNLNSIINIEIKHSSKPSYEGTQDGKFKLTINYRVNIPWNKNDLRDDIIYNSIQILKNLYTNPDFKDIEFCLILPYISIIDKYGNNKEASAGLLGLKRSVARKINWDNMTNERFENLLKEEGGIDLSGI